MSRLRWGIIGPGSIAREFAGAMAGSPTSELVAVASRNPERPGLAEAFSGARVLGGYETLLSEPDVDAIYIAVPHTLHAEWAIKALEAGKHVLCEKPMALNAGQAERMVAAAQRAGKFLGEAFMYRLHPMTAKIAELVRSGIIGEVRLIQANFGIQMEEFGPDFLLYRHETGGGGILDVGCYTVSMARFIAGAAAGTPFLDPVSVEGAARLGRTGVDEWAGALLRFDNGVIAQLSCAISVALDNMLRIHGETGWIDVHEFWSAGGGRGDGQGRIHIVREDGPRETIITPGSNGLYTYEIEAVGAAIAAGRQEFSTPGMGWADTLGNMRVLDKWRADAGLRYAGE